jgi:hypothetical protein
MSIRWRLIPEMEGQLPQARFTIDVLPAGPSLTVEIQHAEAPDDGEEPSRWTAVGPSVPLGVGETIIALPSGLKDRIRFSLRDEAGGSDLSPWLLPEHHP